MNSRRCSIQLQGDNSQINFPDLIQQMTTALQLLGYAPDAISFQVLTQAQWLAGACQNGVSWFGISLAAPVAKSDAQIAADVASAAQSLNYDISGNGPWTVIGSPTVYDVPAQPVGGIVPSVPVPGFPIL